MTSSPSIIIQHCRSHHDALQDTNRLDHFFQLAGHPVALISICLTEIDCTNGKTAVFLPVSHSQIPYVRKHITVRENFFRRTIVPNGGTVVKAKVLIKSVPLNVHDKKEIQMLTSS